MTLTIAFAGHTSLILQTPAGNLITDPNFSSTAGLVSRREPPVFDPFVLHQTTAVIVSNAHFNRLNFPSFKYFKTDCPMLIPKGLKQLCQGHVNNRWIEMQARSEFTAGDFRILALPAAHTGARFTSLRYRASLHYLIRVADLTILYCGDSAYTRDFAEIGAEFAIDVAILPIDKVGPELSRGVSTLTPETALRAFSDLKAKRLIPNAFGAFVAFGTRNPQAAPTQLKHLATAAGLSDRVSILAPGQSITL